MSLPSRNRPPKTPTAKIVSRILTLLVFLLLLSLFFWYVQMPPKKEVPAERWNEGNIGLDVDAEHRDIVALLPGAKTSALERERERQAQLAREEAIRKEEREKLAAEQAKADEEARLKAEAEQKAAEEKAAAEQEPAEPPAEFDKALADYDTALYFFFQRLDEELSFLSMQIDTLNTDPSYVETMDFAVSFSEGASSLLGLSAELDAVVPPPEVADAHAYLVDAVAQLSAGAFKISDGAAQYDRATIEEGLLDWGMAINYMGRAQQQLDDAYAL